MARRIAAPVRPAMVVPIATYCSSLSQSACPTAVTAGRHSPGRAVVVAPTPSFSAALGRQALAPVADREEMTKIATSIGLDPEQAQNIDVVAALFYAALSRSLRRTATVQGLPRPSLPNYR